jgi:hypothetical protein
MQMGRVVGEVGFWDHGEAAFERAAKSAFTAVYDGHARVTLPVTQDARARVAHGAQRALVARNPVTGTPLKTRLRIESMDSLRFSTTRAAPAVS